MRKATESMADYVLEMQEWCSDHPYQVGDLRCHHSTKGTARRPALARATSKGGRSLDAADLCAHDYGSSRSESPVSPISASEGPDVQAREFYQMLNFITMRSPRELVLLGLLRSHFIASHSCICQRPPQQSWQLRVLHDLFVLFLLKLVATKSMTVGSNRRFKTLW